MRIFLLIAVVILISSCSANNSSTSKSFESFISDTSIFKMYQNITEALNLSHVNNGVDSFELRIWSSLATTDLEFVTILKFADSTWHLTETRYWTSYTNNYPKRDLIILDSSTTKKINPFLNFYNIIDSIKSFHIEAIPAQHEISGFRDRTADGIYYTLEIAAKNKYKFISYHNPNRYEDPMNRKVNEILLFFQRNLNVFVMN